MSETGSKRPKKTLLKKILFSLLGLIVLVIASTFFYTYRWNVLTPNKSASVRIDNLNRSFVYHVPTTLSPKPALIIAYHGSRLKSFMMQIFTGHEFDLLADKHQNAIVVYPQGYEEHWNDCRIHAPFASKKLNLDDVRFTEEIIDYFSRQYKIDTQKVVALGYSNGGQMVMKLAHLRPELFRAFAVISANLPAETNNSCQGLQKPVSIISFSGLEDPLVPYNGGEVFLDGQSYGFIQSAEETLQYWLRANNCDTLAGSSVAFYDNNGKQTAVQTNYNSPTYNTRVSHVKLLDGGHTIPNQHFRVPIKKLGNMNKEVDAPKLIWDFFMQE